MWDNSCPTGDNTGPHTFILRHQTAPLLSDTHRHLHLPALPLTRPLPPVPGVTGEGDGVTRSDGAGGGGTGAVGEGAGAGGGGARGGTGREGGGGGCTVECAWTLREEGKTENKGESETNYPEKEPF